MNTKPTIYTEEKVLPELRSMLKMLKADPEIWFLNDLFDDKEYPVEYFSRWDKKYSKNIQIRHTIKKIRDILVGRALKGGATGKLNPTMVIFHLKNNFGWRDVREVDKTLRISRVIVKIEK